MKCFALIDERPTCISLHEFIEHGGLNIVKTPQEADLIIVGGGDGFMLRSMREYNHLEIPFLGLNCGTLGFLLNKVDETISSNDIQEPNFDTIEIHPLSVTMHMLDGTRQSGFFFNDCVIGGSVLDYVSFTVQHPSKKIEAKGTGLVVSSMLGSTGYALNLGQPLIPVSSNLRGIVGIASAPFQYGFVEPQSMKIERASRNEIVVGLDGYNGKYEGVKYIEIHPSEKIISLKFFKSSPFEEKRLLLAEEKLGNR